MNYDAYFSHALARLRDERRYRVFADLERLAGRFPHAIWHSPQGPRDVIVWCSNDYLGMGQHPKVIGAMVETATRMGTGAGGTRNIAGTNHPLVNLERELADLHRKEAALVFTSGYVSNETGISTIARLMSNCLILSDASNHNSMIEGVRQSKCEKQIFRHNDTVHLEELLRAADPERPKLIVFETLYSMDGDVAPIKAVLNGGGLPVMQSPTHIVPVFVGEPEKCKKASDLLLAEHGIYIQPINYPTVAKGTERLRITPTPYHEDALIDALAEALLDVWERLQLPRKDRAVAAE